MPNRLWQEQTFHLGRSLKGVFELEAAPVKDFMPLVRAWWTLAWPDGDGPTFFEAWSEFVSRFRRIKYPEGSGPMCIVLERFRLAIEANDYPRAARSIDDRAARDLIVLCRELQRHAGDRPFPLSCRDAGDAVALNRTKAAKYLDALCTDGILAVARESHYGSRRATEYRYLPPIDSAPVAACEAADALEPLPF